MPTLRELCDAASGALLGEGAADVVITGLASVEKAGPGDLAPVDGARFLEAALASGASAFVIPPDLEERVDRPCIVTEHVLAGLNLCAERLGLVPAPPPPGVHPMAVVEDGAQVGKGCTIGPFAVIRGGARVGARCRIDPHVVIEGDVVIGEGCRLEPGCVIHDGARLGDRVQVGAHAVISRQGFGFTRGPKGVVQLHHLGLVVIGNDVRIGAGDTIDRARFDETRVGDMSAFDNLVHLGHNCTVGARTFMAAQSGMAGNSHLGSDCEVGGQVGLSNQVRLGDRCRVAAQSGVMGEWADGTQLFGSPAVPRREAFRRLKLLERLLDEAGRKRKPRDSDAD